MEKKKREGKLVFLVDSENEVKRMWDECLEGIRKVKKLRALDCTVYATLELLLQSF